MHRFKENVKTSIGIAAPIATSTVAVFHTAGLKAGIGCDMAKYNNFAGCISQVAGTQWQGDVTYYIAQSTDNTTFSTAYLATTTISSSTTTNQVGTIECRAEQMSDSYRYLRVEALPATGTGNVYSVQNLRFNSRFLQATLPA